LTTSTICPVADPEIRMVFKRHAVRRDAGIPTVTVLVGPPGTARRTWRRWTENTGTPALECPPEPLGHLREWAFQHRLELAKAILERLAARTRRDPETMIRDWPHKTLTDMDAFWNALPPEHGDDLFRRVLSPEASDFPDERTLPHLLDRELPGFRWSVLFTAVTSPAILLSWGELAQKHPKLSLTVAVPASTWAEFVANATDTRAKTILLEGEFRLPWLEPSVVVQALIAGGVPKSSAEQLAEAGGDAEMVEATIALAQATAAPPATPDADDDARSKAERALYSYLENLPETAGRFALNANLDFKFGNKWVEIDLLCTAPKIAIEVDGYYHFRDANGYRRDRSKDWELQKRGFLVLRFLAEDVTLAWGTIRDRVLEAIKGDER